MIPSADPGIELYIRNRRQSGVTRFAADKTLLFVHGSTFPAETVFDLRLDGMSWMEYIASHGYDVYLVTLRGYGRSTRPREMDEPPDANPPLTRTADAVKDVGAAVDFILKRGGISSLNLMGWSWGTSIMATYTTRNNDKVEKLALIAPQWLRKDAGSPLDTGGKLGAYRTMTREQMGAHWYRDVPSHKQAGLVPKQWLEQWMEAAIASDAAGAKMAVPVVRAPNGTLQDTRDYWCSGKTLYDPQEIRVPVLLAHAEWDEALPAYMPQTLFPLLINAPYKRYIEFGEGTHYLMMEKNRMQVFREVQLFFDERYPAV